MSSATKASEQRILDSLLNAYPSFLQEGLCWEPGPKNESPDFIATTPADTRLGLELTEWLDTRQTKASISNQESRKKLLEALDSEHRPCPSPLTRVIICDRLEVPFRASDLREYVQEVHRLTADYAPLWERNQAIGIWNIKQLTEYPTLARYCVCLCLYGPPRFGKDPRGFDWNHPGARWIVFEPVGKVYNPQWSVDALLSRIQTKTGKYIGIHRDQSLDQFVLLAHYGIRGIMHNTPFHGRNARFEDAARQAHEYLLKDHGAFDAAYLYMDFNGGKLVQLFPFFTVLREFSHPTPTS